MRGQETAGGKGLRRSSGRLEDSEGSFCVLDFGYLLPCELCRELPVEQIVLVQAETLVDQSILRGDA